MRIMVGAFRCYVASLDGVTLSVKGGKMKKLTRRNMLRVSVGMGFSAAGAHIVSRSAAAERTGSITVSTWGGDTEDSIRKFVQPKFEALTKATIVYDIGGQGARYNKLIAQRNSPSSDVFLSTDEVVVQGLQQELLLPPNMSNISNAKDIRTEALTIGEAGGCVPYTIIAYVLGYNSKRVQKPLTSWADLWRGDLANRLAFAAPAHTQMPALVIIAAELAGGGVNNIDPGFKLLADLRPAKLAVSWTDWASAYQSGDIIAATEFDLYFDGMKTQTFDIDYAVPKEKGIGVPEYASIVKGTQNKELCEVFLNMMLDPDVQENFAKATFQGPTNSKVSLSPDLAAKVSYGARLEQLRFFDPAFAAKNRAMWTERLNTEVVPNWRVR
jgi:putative spermidine/putrescine transport system substrate-binding protein